MNVRAKPIIITTSVILLAACLFFFFGNTKQTSDLQFYGDSGELLSSYSVEKFEDLKSGELVVKIAEHDLDRFRDFVQKNDQSMVVLDGKNLGLKSSFGDYHSGYVALSPSNDSEMNDKLLQQIDVESVRASIPDKELKEMDAAINKLFEDYEKEQSKLNQK